MYTIIWPDGKVDKAETMDALYDQLVTKYSTWVSFRITMVRRAKKWSNTHISLLGNKTAFLRALARARMFTLVEE